MKRILLSSVILMALGTNQLAAELYSMAKNDGKVVQNRLLSKEDVNGPNRIKHKPSKKIQKVISYDQPSGEWSEWQDFGVGSLTIENSLSFTTALENIDGVYDGIHVEQRHDIANENIRQFLLRGIINDADIIVDYYPTSDGLLKIRSQSLDLMDDFGANINILDFASCYESISAEEMGMSEEEFDAIITEYNSYNYFIPTLGRFYIFCGFMAEGESDACAMCDMNLQLDGYSDFTPKFGDITFFDSEKPEISISLDPGVEYIRYGFFDGIANQNAIDSVLAGGDGIGTITEDGTVSIPYGDVNRVRNITAITFDAEGTALEWGFAPFTIIDDEAEEWKSLGEADVVSELMECLIFEWDPTEYKVEIQQHKENPNRYRLVNPFGEPFPLHASATQYDTEFNHYLELDASDPECVLLPMQHTGHNWGGGQFVLVGDASYDISMGKNPEDVRNMAGKFTDGVFTFPEKGILVWCPDWKVFGGENGNLYICNAEGKTKITLPKSDGADLKIDCASGSSKYFNLQGMEIQNPTKDSVVIVKSGDKISKRIFR